MWPAPWSTGASRPRSSIEPAGLRQHVLRDLAHSAVSVGGEVEEVVGEGIAPDFLGAPEMPVERTARLADSQTLRKPLVRHVEPRGLDSRRGYGRAYEIEMPGSLDHPRQQEPLDARGLIDRR